MTLRPPRAPEAEPVRAAEPAPAPTPMPAPAPVPPAVAQAPVAAHLLEPTAIDPEFLQLFVEEARENVTQLEALFPQ